MMAVVVSCTEGAQTPQPAESSASEPPHGEPDVSWAETIDGLKVQQPKVRKRLPGSNLPIEVPRSGDALPDLLDDLPGRAVMTSYSPPRCVVDRGESSYVLFYGVDGEWRRLIISDLGISAVSEEYSCDVRGSGALSPNGRLWAMPAESSLVVLNLKTGRVESRPLAKGGQVFIWSPSGQQLAIYEEGMKLASLWTFPLRKLTNLPSVFEYDTLPVLLQQGGYVIGHEPDRLRRGADDTMRLDFFSLRGYPLRKTFVPIPPGEDCNLASSIADKVVLSCRSKNEERFQLYVLSLSDWRAMASLVLPSRQGLYPGGPWLDSRAWLLETGIDVTVWRPKAQVVASMVDLPPESVPYFSGGFSLAGDLVFSRAKRGG